MVQAYPLQWPQGWQRTKFRKYSRFDTSRSKAISNLYNELRLLGAKAPVISSNVMIYERGGKKIPYADQSVNDPAVAVYFEFNGSQQCIPCDKWKSVADNIHAVGKTIQALRGIERWGAKEMVNAAFKGFQALPDYTNNRPPIIPQQHYFSDCIDRLDVKAKYKKLVKKMHPDRDGNTEEFQEMKRQYERRMKLL